MDGLIAHCMKDYYKWFCSVLAFKTVDVTCSAMGVFALFHKGHHFILGLQNKKEDNLGILKMELSEQQFTNCSTAEEIFQIWIWRIQKAALGQVSVFS